MTTRLPTTYNQNSAGNETEFDSFCPNPRRKRDRTWEKKHQDHKAVYRGVDAALVLKVKNLAADLFMSEGVVAKSILEYAVYAYEDGYLTLYPRLRPNRARRTIYPSSQGVPKSAMKHKSNKSPQATWRKITTWRNFSPELKRTISTLASEEGLNVPVGELVSALLRYGLNAHEAGLLKLDVNEKAVVLSLLEGDKP